MRATPTNSWRCGTASISNEKSLSSSTTANLLRQELRKVKAGEDIAIGTATDPYQPAERRFEVMRAILEEFSLHSGLEIGIVTKSNLVLRDIEILREVGKKNRIAINITITTLNTDLARILEPRAPRPDLRLEAVRKLNQAGIHAGVICAPVLPGITDSPRDLEALVRATSEARGKYIYANPLFLKPCSAAIFLPFLEKAFPHLVESYRQRFSGKAFLSSAYRKQLSQLMARLREKYRIRNRGIPTGSKPDSASTLDSREKTEIQLNLF
jgi:DNA repair photolyase